METSNLPKTIVTEEELDEVLSNPSESLINMVKKIEGDIMILGIAGKIGVNLGIMASRAIHKAQVNKKVVGVSRFSDPSAKKKIESFGIDTITCDLLDRESVEKLPRVPNIIFMAGRKFGSSGSEELTWAMNTLAPAYVAGHFKESKIVVYSSCIVYGLVPIEGCGSTENDILNPIGEYAQSVLGRERIFEYFSRLNKTPVCLIRVGYATDLRYGVLRDIGEKVFADAPVDVTMGHVNVIWQGDTINQSLLCLEHCTSPPKILNISGPETLSIRSIAEIFGKIFGKSVKINGKESPSSYLADASSATKLFGYPSVSALTTIEWIAKWIEMGGRSLDKPTHFQARDGRY